MHLVDLWVELQDKTSCLLMLINALCWVFTSLANFRCWPNILQKRLCWIKLSKETWRGTLLCQSSRSNFWHLGVKMTTKVRPTGNLPLKAKFHYAIATRFKLSRHVEIARTCLQQVGNQVCDLDSVMEFGPYQQNEFNNKARFHQLTDIAVIGLRCLQSLQNSPREKKERRQGLEKKGKKSQHTHNTKGMFTSSRWIWTELKWTSVEHVQDCELAVSTVQFSRRDVNAP